MKKFFNKIHNKMNALSTKAKNAVNNIKAEGFVDTGVKIIISVVVGAVILGGLYLLFDNIILWMLNHCRRYSGIRIPR